MGCGASSVVQPDEAQPVDRSHFDIERVIGQGGFGKVRRHARVRGNGGT